MFLSERFTVFDVKKHISFTQVNCVKSSIIFFNYNSKLNCLSLAQALRSCGTRHSDSSYQRRHLESPRREPADSSSSHMTEPWVGITRAAGRLSLSFRIRQNTINLQSTIFVNVQASMAFENMVKRFIQFKMLTEEHFKT